MNSDIVARLFGGLVGAAGFAAVGWILAGSQNAAATPFVVVGGLFGLLAGLIITPSLTTRPARRLRAKLIKMPAEQLSAMIAGLFVGLAVSALLSFPLAALPDPFGAILPLAAAVIICYFSVVVLVRRQQDLGNFFQGLRVGSAETTTGPESAVPQTSILLDTSVIIDGRIADISKTGFIRSEFLVPNFILSELQHIADSAETLRRNRGRRGLEVLRILQQEAPVPVRITDMDASEVREVDAKLVALARELHCPIMTNDYNLNRVAELQGVSVLNINDLANAVKSAFLPGEKLHVKIIQEGKEYGQGVGYLEDGTMVVVEDARNAINRTLSVTVTKVLQTTAGRMVFARP